MRITVQFAFSWITTQEPADDDGNDGGERMLRIAWVTRPPSRPAAARCVKCFRVLRMRLEYLMPGTFASSYVLHNRHHLTALLVMKIDNEIEIRWERRQKSFRKTFCFCPLKNISVARLPTEPSLETERSEESGINVDHKVRTGKNLRSRPHLLEQILRLWKISLLFLSARHILSVLAGFCCL